jgi:transcription elongation factor GreB
MQQAAQGWPVFLLSIDQTRKGSPMRAPYITRAGYQRLSDELDFLLRVRRPELTRAVSEAAAQGDRSENAEYIYGKKLLRETDRRIRFLQKRIPDLQVIDRQPDDPSRVFFGAYVELEDDQGKTQTLRIVGSDEFEPSQHWISIESPMARALLGKRIDDDIIVLLPHDRRASYWITQVNYEE